MARLTDLEQCLINLLVEAVSFSNHFWGVEKFREIQSDDNPSPTITIYDDDGKTICKIEVVVTDLTQSERELL